MAIFLSEADVGKLASMDLAIESVESCMADLADGNGIDIPRVRTRLPRTALHILQGALPRLGIIGYKSYTSNRSGNRFTVHLYDAETGQLRSVLEANLLGLLRTGAASAVATRHLACKNARQLGLIGSGWQAMGHLEAISQVRSLGEVRVFSRDAARLAHFCQRESRRLDLKIIPAASASHAVEGADIIGTVTTASAPLFEASAVKEGAHINAAGSNALIRQELSESMIRRCSGLFVDSIDVALKESGDLFPLLEKGRLHSGQLTELGDVILKRRSGRRSEQDITLFESQGLAIQDLALAARLTDLAIEQKIGTPLPYGD